MFPPFPTSMSVFRGVVLVERALGDRFGWRLLCHARGKCPGSYVPFCHKLRGGGLLRYCPAFHLLPTFQRLKSVNLKRTQREGDVKKCTFSFCQLNLEALFDQLQTLLQSVLCPACWKMFHFFFSTSISIPTGHMNAVGWKLKMVSLSPLTGFFQTLVGAPICKTLSVKP